MANKLVLLTGASGFLGNYLCAELERKNISTISIGRSSNSSSQHIQCDLTVEAPRIPERPSKVIHCAGLAHVVPRTDTDKRKFTTINVDGTRNLLKGLLDSNAIPDLLVFVSSVAVYGLDSGRLIDENQPAKPNTPYGRSKLECEKLLTHWCEEHKVKLLIIRPPLILGKYAKGNLESLTNAIIKGYYVSIKNNKSCKSAIHAHDLSQFLVEADNIVGIFNITDGNEISFIEVEQLYTEIVGKKILLNIPLSILKIAAFAGDLMLKVGMKFPITNDKLTKMTTTLTFSDKKLRETSEWNPKSAIARARDEID